MPSSHMMVCSTPTHLQVYTVQCTTVDDGSGVISCVQWRKTRDSSEGLYVAGIGQLVSVLGQIDDFREERLVRVANISEPLILHSSIHSTPYTLLRTLHSLHSTPYTLLHTLHSLHSTPYTLLHTIPYFTEGCVSVVCLCWCV